MRLEEEVEEDEKEILLTFKPHFIFNSFVCMCREPQCHTRKKRISKLFCEQQQKNQVEVEDDERRITHNTKHSHLKVIAVRSISASANLSMSALTCKCECVRVKVNKPVVDYGVLRYNDERKVEITGSTAALISAQKIDNKNNIDSKSNRHKHTAQIHAERRVGRTNTSMPSRHKYK